MVDDPLDDPVWRAHLFRTRAEDQIGRWAGALDYFRFCRGRVSPFFTDADRLLVALAWSDEPDRRAVLDRLDLADGPDGWHDLAGGRVRVEQTGGRITLGVSGIEQRRPEIIDADVEVASAIESCLSPMAERVIDPPLDDRSCVAPGRYPTLFVNPR